MAGSSTPHPLGARQRWKALLVLCLGVLMIVLDTTIVNAALPSIRADLGFTETSLVCGLANTQGLLVTARAVQGLGGAVVSAVALSLIMNLFSEPGERAKAIGVYGFVCASGGSIGVLLGGLLTGRLDVAGAATITSSLMLAVDGNVAGWASVQTLVLLGSAAALFAWVFISALYMQRLLGYTPLQVGLGFVPANIVMALLSLAFSARIVMRFGTRGPLAFGLLLAAAGVALTRCCSRR